MINPSEYHICTAKLRRFFEARGFIEVPTQSRLSILAACEDPTTIANFAYQGQEWPLPQTGQMWLEYELLKNPDVPGFFCVSTSYRQEPNPIAGRHETIFPMFEFESKGDLHDLQKLEEDLLEDLGFGAQRDFVEMNYDDACRQYQTDEISAAIETQIAEDYGAVFFLKNFPIYTSPFWNMKKQGDHACKIDVLLHGMETIGSAERSANPEEMRHLFHTISNGRYAEILYSKFGKQRVEQEMEEFLSHDFFPRFGGGIGVTRMIRAMKLSHILNHSQSEQTKKAA